MKSRSSIDVANSIFNARVELDRTRAIVNALFIVTEGMSGTQFEEEDMNLALTVVRQMIDKVDDELQAAEHYNHQNDDDLDRKLG